MPHSDLSRAGQMDLFFSSQNELADCEMRITMGRRVPKTSRVCMHVCGFVYVYHRWIVYMLIHICGYTGMCGCVCMCVVIYVNVCMTDVPACIFVLVLCDLCACVYMSACVFLGVCVCFFRCVCNLFFFHFKATRFG